MIDLGEMAIELAGCSCCDGSGCGACAKEIAELIAALQKVRREAFAEAVSIANGVCKRGTQYQQPFLSNRTFQKRIRAAIASAEEGEK